MPYFQRKPVEGLIDTVGSHLPIPGLPSRSPGLTRAVTAGLRPDSPLAAITGIVEQATAVLASERPSASPMPAARSDVGPITSMQNARVSQLQNQINALIEQFAGLVARPPNLRSAMSSTHAVQRTSSDPARRIVEPAPVLSPAGPVAPGGTAQITIALVNEDEQPAQIVFFGTELIGEDGERIPAERVSFQPRELMLLPEQTGEVIVRVAIPAQTRCGGYSGLVRASNLDYLHAVLVVQVEYP